MNAAVRLLASLLLVLLVIVVARGSRAEDSLAAKWQQRIDNEPQSDFDAEACNILRSLRDYYGKCQVHMVFDPARSAGAEDLTLKFVREGKEVLVIKGHFCSVFRTEGSPFGTEGKILYFAEFDTSACGCSLVAYDLRTGREVWRNNLKGVGLFDHSIYRNRVKMDLYEGVVRIRGHESGGDYVEIVDQKTGKTIAHRVFESKPPKDKE
jgi:hypothetical protein